MKQFKPMKINIPHIDYIIVKDEKMVHSLIKKMKKTNWANRNENALNLIISSIITVEKLRNDF